MKAVSIALAALLFAGCAGYYEQSADRETDPIVRRLNESVTKELPQEVPAGVLTPKPSGPSIESTTAVTATGAPRILTLQESLKIAFTTSRDYQFARESLYLSALAFTQTRHQYDWRPAAAMTGALTSTGGTRNIAAPGDPPVIVDSSVTSADASATMALTRQLLSGGTFALTGTADQSGILSGAAPSSNSSTAAATFLQPLLEGSGVAAREQLVQATRSLLYDARAFELFRQQLTIETLSGYYNLILQKRFIATAEANARQSEFLYERSKALFDKGKMILTDVFRAEGAKLQADNDLVDQIASYNLALDRYKVSLGIPTDENIEIADEPIEPAITEVNVESAVKTALSSRLDLLTSKQQLVDAERGTEVARNALLPQLDYFARVQGAGNPGDLLNFDRRNASATTGLTLVLPLDKLAERNNYKASIITLARQRRQYQLAQDNAILQVRDTVRNLQQAEVTLVIQKRSLQSAKDQLESAQLLMEKGTASNRDVVDAQNAVQSAENAYAQAQVNYIIGYIQFRRDIGILKVDEQGRWY